MKKFFACLVTVLFCVNAFAVQFSQSQFYDFVPAGSGGGSGDVVGPSSSTQYQLPVFGDTSGKLLIGSPIMSTATGYIMPAGLKPLTTNANNYILMGEVGANQASWLQLRSGGSPVTPSGLIFSTKDNQHFFQYANASGLLSHSYYDATTTTPDYSTATTYMTVSPVTGNVGFFNVSTNADFDVPGGFESGTSLLSSVGTSASPEVVSNLDSRKVFTNDSASETTYFSLPSAPVVTGQQNFGTEFTFCQTSLYPIRVYAATGSTIKQSTSTTTSGGFVASTRQYTCIVLIGINATTWLATSATGSWTYN